MQAENSSESFEYHIEALLKENKLRFDKQVVTELHKVPDFVFPETKYLCTLQQSNSARQLEEMKSENVVLVMPEIYRKKYPRECQNDIMSIQEFIAMVKEKLGDM